MRRLVLHIGPHKTGTSAFQEWLLNNSQALMAEGIAFPAELTDNGGNAVRLGRALLSNPAGLTVKQRELQQTFADFCAAHPAHDVIISAELLSQTMIQRTNADGDLHGVTIFKNPFQQDEDPEVAGLARHARRALKARWLARNLAPLGFDRVDVICMVRDNVNRQTSAWLQVLKTLAVSFDFHGIETGMLPNFMLTESFAHYETLGFSPRAALYRDPTDTRPVARRLMDLAGYDRLDWSAFATPDSVVNPSPGYLKAIGLGHMIHLLGNQLQTRDRADVLQTARRLAAVAARSDPAGDSRLQLFAPGAAHSFLARQIASLKGVENWMPGYTAESIAATFPAFAPQSPLSWAQLNRQERASLDAWLTLIAADAAEDPELSTWLDLEQLRDITTAPRGILATPATYAPCLGGVWVNQQRTGAPPPFTVAPGIAARPFPVSHLPE